MQQIEEGFKEIWLKLAIFIPGVLVGLLLRISTMGKEKRLTWWNFLFRTSSALFSAWILWFFLEWKGWGHWAPIAAPFCGRFGDEIILFVVKHLRENFVYLLKRYIK